MRPGGRIVQLKRCGEVADSGALQWRMCMIKDLDFDVVASSIEEFKSQHGGAHAPQIIGGTCYLKQFLDDNGFLYSDDDLLPDDMALIQYRRQLELFKKNNGGKFLMKLKKSFIKTVTCFVPGRVNRGRVRKYLKEHL